MNRAERRRYAWIMAHWYDAIVEGYPENKDFAEQAREFIPPEVSGEQWRFVVEPPSLAAAEWNRHQGMIAEA